LDISAAAALDGGGRADLPGLLAACAERDGSASLEMEKSLNAHGDMPSFFLAREGGRLLGALSIFAPKRGEAELGALVLPEARRRGIFSSLLSRAEVELSRFGYSEELFLVESRSEAGKAAAEKLGARYEFAEYAMRYSGSPPPAKAPGLELRRVGIELLEELALLRSDAYGDSPEDALSFERATFAAANRQQYAAFLEGRMVAACSLAFEEHSVSINALVVEAASRGVGLGQSFLGELLSLLAGRGLEIVLDVESLNANACHVYRKAGFEATRSVEYYRRRIPGK
jgi:GNAT superfamily N-acetyltransferase